MADEIYLARLRAIGMLSGPAHGDFTPPSKTGSEYWDYPHRKYREGAPGAPWHIEGDKNAVARWLNEQGSPQASWVVRKDIK